VAVNIAIPKLGMSMREATLVEWKFKEGEFVEEGQVVLIIETDKTKWEVEASGSGFLHVEVPADETEPVGKIVGFLVESLEELGTIKKEPVDTIHAATEVEKTSVSASTKPPGAKGGKEKRIRISPLARRMAEEMDIDPATVTGTGPGGRITKTDIQNAQEEMKEKDASQVLEKGPALERVDGKKVKTTIPIKTGMRKAIADHMRRSLDISAQLTLTGEIEMTEVKRLRIEFLKKEEVIGTRITYNDIFVLATARALKDHPIINSSLLEDEIKIWEDINIGIAVALISEELTGGGLIVPVIKHADRMSLTEISLKAGELVKKAREGKLMPDEVTGGTFTITNIGVAGVGYGYSTPIINQPEAAILGTGTITDRPVVRDGEIVIRPIMPCSLTFDHRIIDGYPASVFMSRLTELIENPMLLL